MFQCEVSRNSWGRGQHGETISSPGFWAGEPDQNLVALPREPQQDQRMGRGWPCGGWSWLAANGMGVSLTSKGREGACSWSKQGEGIYILELILCFLRWLFSSITLEHIFFSFHLLSNKYGLGTLPKALPTWDHCPQNNSMRWESLCPYPQTTDEGTKALYGKEQASWKEVTILILVWLSL